MKHGRLAVNGHPLDEDHYILGCNDHFSGTVLEKALEDEGITVYRIPFGTTMKTGDPSATGPIRR
jgi:hypothetical protein